eukprot:200771-Lingulodinium_polyedra.AAC.1
MVYTVMRGCAWLCMVVHGYAWVTHVLRMVMRGAMHVLTRLRMVARVYARLRVGYACVAHVYASLRVLTHWLCAVVPWLRRVMQGYACLCVVAHAYAW